mgnify:CR=1 FL=1
MNLNFQINNLLKKFLLRGKVELNIKLLGISDDSFSFNKNVIKNYFKDLNDISKFDKSQLLNSILNQFTKNIDVKFEKNFKKNN